ncbi:MAG: hypothetical protein KF833_18750 [Verrucomicrobiae bacterium]|nr:hypothetical protein [Verrucomicrobiae bacterium]
MNPPGPSTLVCFAVREEAAPFRAVAPADTRVLVTGMGAANAALRLRRHLVTHLPRRVVTAGYAGGLNPDLPAGTVLFSTERDPELTSRLPEAGAVPGTFHCASRVAVTTAEKRNLREATGADAVEMESGIIADVCREHLLPVATVRVILDPADADLPLDFNALMTPRHTVCLGRLIGHLLLHPGAVPRLLRFRRECARAAQRLAKVLRAAL